jgi:hypothetical protein
LRGLDQQPALEPLRGESIVGDDFGKGRAEVVIPLVVDIPIDERAGDGVPGDFVIKPAGRHRGLDPWVVGGQWTHLRGAVAAAQALAARVGAKPGRTFLDKEAPRRHRPHERFDGPDHGGEVLQHAALEDLGVVAVGGGEGLGDGKAEHGVFPGGPPVVEEDIAQGVPGLVNVDGELWLADGRGQLGNAEEGDGGELDLFPRGQRQRIVLGQDRVRQGQASQRRAQQQRGQRRYSSPLPPCHMPLPAPAPQSGRACRDAHRPLPQNPRCGVPYTSRDSCPDRDSFPHDPGRDP